MIHIMHVLCASNSCVVKYSFPLATFETDNESTYLYIEDDEKKTH